MSRIRHATETFVNDLIKGVKKLIESNTEQINVLLQRNHLPAKDNRGVVTKPSNYKSQFTFAGLKSEGVTGLPTWSHVFGVNAYSGIDGFTNVYEYAFCNGEMYIRNQYPLNEDTWGEWKQLATTSKTDILSSDLLNGWVFDDTSIEENIIRTGNIVSLHLVIKNPTVQGNNSHIYTIPSEYRPTKIVARDTKLRNSNTSIIVEVLPTGILRCNGYTEVNRTLSIDISWVG